MISDNFKDLSGAEREQEMKGFYADPPMGPRSLRFLVDIARVEVEQEVQR